jgi:hypothetical protein
MAEKKKRKGVVLLRPKNPPDSFTRAELLAALKKVKAARLQKKKPPVSDDTK